MTIVLHVPVWLLWLIGVPLTIVILALAVFGFFAFRALSSWRFGGWG